MEKKIFYLCNQKKCKLCSAKYGDCKHTSDRNFALHKGQVGIFKKVGEDLFEMDINKDDIVIMEV